MAEIRWDSQASLMRITTFATTEVDQEELLARGTVRELVGHFMELTPLQQRGLLLRQDGGDETSEYDSSGLRELAARPEYTGAYRG